MGLNQIINTPQVRISFIFKVEIKNNLVNIVEKKTG